MLTLVKKNGLLYYQNSIFFQLQGTNSAPGPRWGLCLQTPVIGSRSALPCRPHCLEEIAATAVKRLYNERLTRLATSY